MLDYGIDVNYETNDDDCALKTAVNNRCMELVTLLLDRGADIINNDVEVLQVAIDNDDVEMFRYLVSRGTDIHHNNDQLLRAVDSDNHQHIRILLDNGANIHVNNDEPLLKAVGDGNVDITKLLLDYGADINVNNGGLLTTAIENYDEEMATLLIKRGIRVNMDGSELQLAIENKMKTAAKMLVHRGVSVIKAIAYAIEYENVDIVNMLINYKASMNGVLIEAFAHDSRYMIKYLLDKVRISTDELNTCLPLAVKYGSASIVESMLLEGADIHVNNDEVLRIAAYSGSIKMIRIVAIYGAKIETAFKDDPDNVIIPLLRSVIDYHTSD